MSHLCPSCQRILYNRRLKRCGFCNATIPERMRFSPEKIASLEREMAELESSRRQRELAQEAALAAAQAQALDFIPIIIS